MTDDDRFEELWADYLEGDLDEAGRGELQRLLTAEPRMQRAVDAYEIHRLLGMLAAEAELPAGPAQQNVDTGPSVAEAFVAETMAQLRADDDAFAGDVMSRIGGLRPSVTEHVVGSQREFTRGMRAAAAAAILCSLVAIVVFFIRQRDGGAVPAGPAPQMAAVPAAIDRGDPAQLKQPLATITQQKFLLPADPERPLSVGQPLEPGHVQILGGAIEMTLRNGVAIVLEGPGDLELRGELEAFLHAGRVVVRMPEGMSGFRLDTATTDVLDLGTEFAVKAGVGFVTDVQVYEGAVIASGRSPEASGRFPKRLEAGQAARFSPQAAAEAETLPFAESRFIRRLLPDVGIPHRAPETRDATARAADLRQYGRAEQAASIPLLALRACIESGLGLDGCGFPCKPEAQARETVLQGENRGGSDFACCRMTTRIRLSVHPTSCMGRTRGGGSCRPDCSKWVTTSSTIRARSAYTRTGSSPWMPEMKSGHFPMETPSSSLFSGPQSTFATEDR